MGGGAVLDDSLNAEMRFYTRLVLDFCFPNGDARNGRPGGDAMASAPSRSAEALHDRWTDRLGTDGAATAIPLSVR